MQILSLSSTEPEARSVGNQEPSAVDDMLLPKSKKSMHICLKNDESKFFTTLESKNYNLFGSESDNSLSDESYSMIGNNLNAENTNTINCEFDMKASVLYSHKKRKRKTSEHISSKNRKLESQLDSENQVTELCPESPNDLCNYTAREPLVIPLNRSVQSEKINYIQLLKKEAPSRHVPQKKQSTSVNIAFISNLMNTFLNSPFSKATMDAALYGSSDMIRNEPKTIFKAIVDILKQTDECLDYHHQFSKSPRMPISIKKILMYLHVLGKQTENLFSKFIEEFLFSTDSHKYDQQICMNLTHLYIGLLDLSDIVDRKNCARIFLAKCFYFYNDFAYPMVHQVILAFPGVLPSKDDISYDRSDALINTLQCILMNTYYANSTNTHLKMMKLFNLLTYRYKYESMKPSKVDLIQNLVSKIKAGKTKNVSLCFAVLCKRNDPKWVENIILEQHLLPLLTEYYKTLHTTDGNDRSIACLLETISLLVKPMNLSSDISSYLNTFSQFMSAAVGKKIVQEAALCALLRLARFGFVNCYNLIKNFRPCGNNDLSKTTKAILKTFLCTKKIKGL